VVRIRIPDPEYGIGRNSEMNKKKFRHNQT
jgi:hypothetical protein